MVTYISDTIGRECQRRQIRKAAENRIGDKALTCGHVGKMQGCDEGAGVPRRPVVRPTREYAVIHSNSSRLGQVAIMSDSFRAWQWGVGSNRKSQHLDNVSEVVVGRALSDR